MGALDDLRLADANQAGAIPGLLGSLQSLAMTDLVSIPVDRPAEVGMSGLSLSAVLNAAPVTIELGIRGGRLPADRIRAGRLRPTADEQSVRVVPAEKATLVRETVAATAGSVGPDNLGLNVFGNGGPESEQLVLDAVEVLAAVLLAALPSTSVDGKPGPEVDLDQAMRLAFGAELLTRTGRTVLLGRDVPPTFPEEFLLPFGELEALGCFRQIRDAAVGVAAARTASGPQAVGVIASITPIDACAGETVTITGTGFGSDGVVIFTGTGGALIVRATTWSATEVAVVVPTDARSGPIGLYESASGTGAQSLASAAIDFVDAMGCLGPAAQAKAAGLQGKLATPPLQLSLTYHFSGGKPVVRSFTIDGGATRATRPGQRVTLAWQVIGTKVTVTPSGGAPPLPAAPQLDAVGRGSMVIQMPHATVPGGSYTLKVDNKCASSTAQVAVSVAQTIAFALGGGGARGDFQLGALRYLSEKGIKPNALATTSVGSVNGLQLAHGDRGGTTAQAKLEDTWLTKMNGCPDMFTLSPLTAQLRSEIEKVLPGIIGSASAGAGIGAGVGLAVLGPLGLVIGLFSGAIAGSAASIDAALKAIMPIVEALTTDGPPIPIVGTTATKPRSGIYTMSPLRALMQAQIKVPEVASSGIELRMVAIALDDSSIVAVDQVGNVWAGLRGRRLERTGSKETLIQGALASSAMPAMFEAQTVANLNCVDGGVREVVPVRVAVDDLGASTVFAINCSAPVAPRTGAVNMSMLSVMGRAGLEIPFTEIAEDDIEPYGGWPDGVVVHHIRPSFNIHDAMVIEPGLIRVAIDYGWMRAADVLDGPAGKEANARVACDRIITLRARAWELEHRIYGRDYKDPQRDPFSHVLDGGTVLVGSQPGLTLTAAHALRALKTEIRDACRDRVRWGGLMPTGYEAWFQRWEFHGSPPVLPLPSFLQQGWVPPDPNPWAVLNIPGSTVPAGQVPAT